MEFQSIVWDDKSTVSRFENWRIVTEGTVTITGRMKIFSKFVTEFVKKA